MKIRKHLSASGLYKKVKKGFSEVEDHRGEQVKISLSDALMSGFAMFSLKDESLLEFDGRRAKPENLHEVYQIENIPCDTQMRTILDEVEAEELRPIYKSIVQELQRGKVLEEFQVMGKYYVVSLDGTGYFSSRKVYCENCLEKKLRNGEIIYYHQMLGAVIVHPEQKAVIPLMPEPIIKQDGKKKNDCERNAAKRFITKLRQDYPKLPFIVVEDALSSNAPHIWELKKHKMRFILGVKEGDHKHLFKKAYEAHEQGNATEFERHEGQVTHRFRFVNQLPLNQSNADLKVNLLQYWEMSEDGIQYFAWVTDFTLTRFNAYDIMRIGRARWKVENETFNTLKNQGYHFEHNFGHGKKNLSSVFASLMMLAFAVDQAQQLACQLFQATIIKLGSKKRLWKAMRALFYSIPFDCMESLYKALLHGYRIESIVILEGET